MRRRLYWWRVQHSRRDWSLGRFLRWFFATFFQAAIDKRTKISLFDVGPPFISDQQKREIYLNGRK